jgi:hypothetical protein
MGIFEAKVTAQLGVDVSDAWDYVMTHDDWRLPYVLSVSKLTEGDADVGSRFENKLKGGGRSWTVINEITSYEPPHKLSWKQTNDEGPTKTIKGTYLLESVDGATTFTLHTTLETRGMSAGPVWLNKWILVRQVYPRFLSQLRQALDE